MSEVSDQLRDLPLESIFWLEPTDITDDQIKNMALSFSVHGQIEPIVVCPSKDKYRGVVGRLRYEGMKYRWRSEPEGKTIQARIREFASEIEIKMWQMAENLHRRQISAMQRARQYRDLHDLLKKERGGIENTLKKETGVEATIQTLADAIESMTGGKENVKTIQHYLSLTKLQPETQEVLTGEKMPLRYGLELLRIKNREKQVKLAEGIRDIPDLAPTVKELKWRVDSVLEEERSERHKERIKKKAEKLRKETGKPVMIRDELSYEDLRKIFQFYEGARGLEECKDEDCPKLGIMLRGNFKQIPICTDLKCYEKRDKEKDERERKEQEESQRAWKDERSKVYQMEPDVRHWRLAVIEHIDNWDLRNLLEVDDRSRESLWSIVKELDLEGCQKLLIQHAIEEILTTPTRWGRVDPWKVWAVQEFGLKKDLFLRED